MHTRLTNDKGGTNWKYLCTHVVLNGKLKLSTTPLSLPPPPPSSPSPPPFSCEWKVKNNKIQEIEWWKIYIWKSEITPKDVLRGEGSAKTVEEGGSLVNSLEWGEFYLDQEGKFQMCGGKVLYMIWIWNAHLEVPIYLSPLLCLSFPSFSLSLFLPSA